MEIKSTSEKYVDLTKATRPFVATMSKLRSAQTLGSALSRGGSYSKAFTLYVKTIDSLLSSDIAKNLSKSQIEILTSALASIQSVDDDSKKAFILRIAIDEVYDSCMTGNNEVQLQSDSDIQSEMLKMIKMGSDMIRSGNRHEGLKLYIDFLKRFQKSTTFSEQISLSSQKIINQRLSEVEQSFNLDLESSIMNIHSTLDMIYSELRLPDVYMVSLQETFCSELDELILKSESLIEFKDGMYSAFHYNLDTMTDAVMRGESQCTVQQISNDYLKFSGTVSRYNYGGFASMRIIPSNKQNLTDSLSGLKGILLEVKNLERVNKRYKFQLANQDRFKAFNWQSKFYAESSDDFKYVYMDKSSFWPSMFGHVLSSPGKVDMSKVDFLGIMISHITEDGKEDVEFVEGPFGIAVRSVKIIREV